MKNNNFIFLIFLLVLVVLYSLSQMEPFGFLKKEGEVDLNVSLVPAEEIDYKEFLPESLVLKHRELFEKEDFKALNESLDSHLSAMLGDIGKEDQLFDAYEAFSVKDDTYEMLFNKWIEEYPQSYQPYMARGIYYSHRGWDARGEKLASETKDSQFEAMREYFKKAVIDLEKAISINDKSLPAYAHLVAFTKTSSEFRVKASYVYKAISAVPETYFVREWYLDTLTPRWGGSYKEMNDFILTSETFENKNPKLKKLWSNIVADMAYTQMTKKAYKVAEELYSEAIFSGDRSDILFDRGRVRSYAKQYDQALKDLNRAIQLNPEMGDYYFYRSVVQVELGQMDDGIRDMHKSLLLEPANEDYIKNKKWIGRTLSRQAYELHKEGKFQMALDAINKAVSLDREQVYNYALRAHIHMNSGRHELAELDARRAIKLEGKNASHYQIMHWILKQRGAYGEMAAYWSHYIELVPDNPQAYSERGDSKYKLGNLIGALEDAEKAKELGHPGVDILINKIKSDPRYKAQVVASFFVDFF